MTKLVAKNIDVAIGGKALVRGASLTIHPGELVIILGPNGAGKTSLLRACLGLIARQGGSVTVGDEPLCALSSVQLARRIAYLPQMRPLAWPSHVQDVVALGRFAYGGKLGRLGSEDAKAVSAAIKACELEPLSQRRADSLSGGELARMHCARAFAAQAPLLIADEPVAALDPRHRIKIMSLIRGYVSGGAGALVILHDIDLAAQYADRLIWMTDGKIIADGPPSETLTTRRLRQVYGIQAEVKDARVTVTGAL